MQHASASCRPHGAPSLAAIFQSVLDLTCHFTSLPLNAAPLPLCSSHFSHRTLSCCRVVEVTPEAAAEAHRLPSPADWLPGWLNVVWNAPPRSCVSPACFPAMKDLTIQNAVHRPCTLCAYFGSAQYGARGLRWGGVRSDSFGWLC